ncbi:hypothetical protein AGABI1DRAFT_35800 [Agaricus bisporus var. burnettii JB137-S8]|uniref:ubiquitinyl hydrolase 1 n=1 Tax=Agaricus bisporus var. burnettii (strain JB137-S8 / ATCC MYA-4627 / FGSC 10392) TaxID=597362 RepID=K5Y1E3_AGABU|nr:uncharacterized protein AGABI1DRAFT_35800 [Agaricus bisporus var. burnettii JB137-S8]EKM81610.1 hypothetical protein AGABI1DRAFT_35800 [Agaricus bisporus var. burnettii JB137-S8]
MSVVDIKNRAKESVRKEASKGSAVSLIHVARDFILRAKEKETNGDLHGAFENYIKSATLLRMAMDSSEFKQEKGKGVLRKAVQDFLSGVGSDLNSRTQSIEERIKSFESTRPSNVDSDDKPVNQSSGGSIADRMRALQDHGLSISSTKRLPREVPSLPLSSPRLPSTSTLLSSPPPSTLTSPTVPSHNPASIAALGPPPSHTFVPTSSLGPPSPPSSPPTSPPSDAVDLSKFAHNFPSIHELEGTLDFNLPSVPTSISSKPSKPSVKDVQIGDLPSPSSSHFGNLALHIERPSSTPITPTSNVFHSRPTSPTRVNAPHKPSGLSATATATADAVPPTAPKIPIPHTNTAFPKDLQKYMHDHSVLVIDVRNRADFDKEHVKAQAVVCIEPSVLLRENVTADALEDSMVIAPKGEAKLFSHRDQFDVVAVCDESSTSFGSDNSPLSILVRVINEQAFRKYLKRMPMLLVGGLEGWRRDLGESEVVHAGESQSISLQHSGSSASPKMANPIPFMNGLSSSSTSGSASSGQFSPSIPSSSPRLPNHVGNHRSAMSLDQNPSHTRLPAEANHTGGTYNAGASSLQRRPAMVRLSISQNVCITFNSGPASPSTLTSGPFSPISYPQFNRPIASASSSALNSGGSGFMTPTELKSPPPASLNLSSTRRRNDYLDQSQEALSSYNNHTSSSHIDYPELLPIRPPPAAASSALERQDQRPRLPPKPDFGHPPPNGMMNGGAGLNGAPKPPRIESDYPVTYWTDVQIGLSGLKNLGNTCYMNAPIQCLSATVPFSRFFNENRWKNAINYTNPFGSKGRITSAFAKLLYQMRGQDLPYVTPIEFRKSICQLRSQYDNSDQHDSQEFLSFLMDGIHEDLNRVIVKPKWTQTPEQEAELERLPPLIASEREWKEWKARNDSIIVDYFQGQFRSRLQCLTCHQTSTTYNVFSILQLPIPHGRNGRVTIERCLDALFNEEILEKDDAWDCPKCKTKRRASKTLSLARLPPVLLIHFKRFEANGRFSDKIDTFVEYPMKSLDLTNYMPAPLPPGADKSELNGGLPMSLEDPRSQLPPYRYDLYAVTNHYGNLTSGHYTSFVASRGGWMYCDDSSIKSVEPKSVINQKAYVLFYKRVR